MGENSKPASTEQIPLSAKERRAHQYLTETVLKFIKDSHCGILEGKEATAETLLSDIAPSYGHLYVLANKFVDFCIPQMRISVHESDDIGLFSGNTGAVYFEKGDQPKTKNGHPTVGTLIDFLWLSLPDELKNSEEKLSQAVEKHEEERRAEKARLQTA